MSSSEQSLLNKNKKNNSKSFKIKKSVARQSTAHSYLVLIGPLFRNFVSLLVEMALAYSLKFIIKYYCYYVSQHRATLVL